MIYIQSAIKIFSVKKRNSLAKNVEFLLANRKKINTSKFKNKQGTYTRRLWLLAAGAETQNMATNNSVSSNVGVYKSSWPTKGRKYIMCFKIYKRKNSCIRKRSSRQTEGRQ